MVTSESACENVYDEGITKCYNLYLNPVIPLFKAAYTGINR